MLTRMGVIRLAVGGFLVFFTARFSGFVSRAPWKRGSHLVGGSSIANPNN